MWVAEEGERTVLGIEFGMGVEGQAGSHEDQDRDVVTLANHYPRALIGPSQANSQSYTTAGMTRVTSTFPKDQRLSSHGPSSACDDWSLGLNWLREMLSDPNGSPFPNLDFVDERQTDRMLRCRKREACNRRG